MRRSLGSRPRRTGEVSPTSVGWAEAAHLGVRDDQGLVRGLLRGAGPEGDDETVGIIADVEVAAALQDEDLVDGVLKVVA